MWLRRPRKTYGQRGEDIAARALRKAGYRVLARNLRLGKYEIDIVARQDDTIAFTEVKTRRSNEVVQPEENVGSVKRRHIIHAARRYIEQNADPNQYYRFDIVSVILPDNGKPQVTIYADAFREE